MAVVDIGDEEEISDAELFEDVHTEIRNVINIRRVNIDARNREQIDAPVHQEIEMDPIATSCLLILLYNFFALNFRHIGLAEPIVRHDEAHSLFVTDSEGGVPETLATSSLRLSEELDSNVGLDQDTDFPFLADTNVASDTDLSLAQEDLSSHDGRSGTRTSQHLSISDSHADDEDLSQRQAELEEMRNPPCPEGTSQLDQVATFDRLSLSETDHDLNRSLDLSAVTASSVKGAVTTEVTTGGQVCFIHENSMEERTNSEHEDDIQLSGQASGHGCRHPRMLRSQRLETKVENDLEEDLISDDHSLSTDQRLADASARKTSGKME